MDQQHTASLLVTQSWLSALFVRLKRKGLLSDQDAIEILELALLNLETNQAITGADAMAVAMARAMLEDMVTEIRASAEKEQQAPESNSPL
jgi:hypothetical protein